MSRRTSSLAREGLETTGRDGYVRWVGQWLDAWESFEVEGGMATRVHLYQDREQARAAAQSG